MGIERLMMVLEAQNAPMPEAPVCDLYIASMGENASLKATALCSQLRDFGYSVQTDICSKGLKAQMKFANKIGAIFTMVLGDNELANNTARLKNMQSGNEIEVNLDDLVDKLLNLLTQTSLDNLTDSIIY